MAICKTYVDMAVFLVPYIYLNKLDISEADQPVIQVHNWQYILSENSKMKVVTHTLDFKEIAVL